MPSGRWPGSTHGMVADPEPPSAGRDRVVTLGRWLTAMRLVAVPLALIQVASFRGSFPAGYEGLAWAVCGLLAAGTVAILGLSPRARSTRARDRLGLGALVLDSAVVLAFILVFSFEPSQPLMALYFLPVAEGALRFGLRGGLVSALLLVPPARRHRALSVEPLRALRVPLRRDYRPRCPRTRARSGDRSPRHLVDPGDQGCRGAGG